jgi:hypothetical protein
LTGAQKSVVQRCTTHFRQPLINARRCGCSRSRSSRTHRGAACSKVRRDEGSHRKRRNSAGDGTLASSRDAERCRTGERELHNLPLAPRSHRNTVRRQVWAPWGLCLPVEQPGSLPLCRWLLPGEPLGGNLHWPPWLSAALGPVPEPVAGPVPPAASTPGESPPSVICAPSHPRLY